MTGSPIVSALFQDEPAGVDEAAPEATATGCTTPLPTDDDISHLGSASRSTYAAVTAKVLDEHKASDLGEMSGKITELVTVAKGLDPRQSRHGLLDRAFGFLHDEREQLLSRMQTARQRLDTIKHEVDGMVALERRHVASLAELQAANIRYHGQMKAAAEQGEQWLAAIKAALALPVDEADSFAGPKRAALQQNAARLEKAVNDFRNAMTLAKQEALTIQMESGNSQALLYEFEQAITLVIPALESILAQQLIQIDQKHAADTDAMLRSTLDAALRTQARLVGDNTVAIAALQQNAAISTTTLLDCETMLEAADAKVRQIEEAGRQARLADATNRTQTEQRLLARFSA
jgi:uncharacterized protein YaaN involved in tellurite resistance